MDDRLRPCANALRCRACRILLLAFATGLNIKNKNCTGKLYARMVKEATPVRRSTYEKYVSIIIVHRDKYLFFCDFFSEQYHKVGNLSPGNLLPVPHSPLLNSSKRER
jgi:hypothetical protein